MMQDTGGLATVLTAVEDAGLFSSVCTIQSPSQAPDALGQPDLAAWTDVAGMVNIPCMKAPIVAGSVRSTAADEVKGANWTEEMSGSHVLLDGYFPLIEQRYRAVIDGVALDILGVEPDSQKIMTRMAVRFRNL